MIGQRETADGAHFAFTDRWGGVSAVPYDQLNLGGAVGDATADVLTNRRLAAGELGMDAADVVWMRQVHGNAVAVTDGPWPSGGEPAVDGVVTTRRGLALAVLTADCLPLLLADPAAGVVGAAHAGRPGLAAGVVGATVAAMIGQGARPERMIARTGPTVCGGCYEVPAALRDEVAAVVPTAAGTTRWGSAALNIPRGVRAQLTEAGVNDIALSPVCTLESADHFSYRRNTLTGRQASYVWLEAR